MLFFPVLKKKSNDSKLIVKTGSHSKTEQNKTINFYQVQR